MFSEVPVAVAVVVFLNSLLVFSMEQPGVVAGNFGLSFSLHFLSIFVHISGSIRLITLIWASLERSFPPAKVEFEYNDANFGQK